MSTSKILNPENMSREELIAMLMKTQSELDTTKEELKKSNEKNVMLEEQLTGVQEVTAEGFRQVSELTQNLNKRVILLDDVLSMNLIEQIEFAFAEQVEWIQNARSLFNQTPFNKGSDVKGSKKKLDEAEAATKKLNGSIKNAGRSINRVAKTIADAVTAMAGIDKTTYGKAAAAINSFVEPARKDEAKKKSIGRVAKNRATTRTVSASLKSHVCKSCGGNTVPYETGKLVDKVIGANHKLNEILGVIKNIHEVEVCEKCGQVSIAIADNQDVPVIPNREIGIDYMLGCSDFICRGMALNNYISPIRDMFEIGNDTISYNLHDFVGIYIKPLYDGIIRAAKEAPVLLLDGTPFDCLESQGSRKSKDRKTEEVTVSKSNYILSMAAPVHAKVQFTAYGYLEKRNFDSIRKVITPDYKFKTLVTDGFSGYEQLLDEHPGAKLQHCLVHLRRYLIVAFDFKNYCEKLDVLDDEECRAFVMKDIEEASDKYLIYSAFNAINKIYALEDSVDYSKDDYLEQINSVREKARELLENADTVMEEMIKRHMVSNKNNTSLVGKKGDIYSRACVYWYQQRPFIKEFLNDPLVPPDTNIVEQAIRPITVFRKNANWKATISYMEDLCMLYSVFMSAKKNGIDDVYGWLRTYCRDLYKYCIEKQWTAYIREGKSLTKKILTWDMVSLSEGFEFNKYQIIKI
ncbi:Transposase IS66 family protein [Succinivibrio dextrinosolvens]|uniref:IS66 family transposase n=1 Tax=Succinivibrio dextrinosolvens TaxID=83771 RepID=UPI0008EEB475|nr:transposase [Succinivibrio dextrinosolvens]SFS87047.1 Transposase IS66 family protein [Succinivibrio dextrinosolvens]